MSDHIICNNYHRTMTVLRPITEVDHLFFFGADEPAPPPPRGGSVVSVSESRPGGCEFDPRLRRLFFPAYFRLLPLQKHVRKVVGGFGKKKETHMRH